MTSFTHYILDGTKVVAQYQTSTSSITPSNIIYFYYDESGSPTGMKYNGNVYFFQKNLQGDIIRILNTQGSIVATYTYDAWGNIISSTDTSGVSIGTKNPFRYRGYYYDTETGLYYLNSRYYDPQVGRFLNADARLNTSLGILGINQFSYCLSNPVNMVDYCGNKPGDLFDTMDEAARDAAIYLGVLSFENGWEYATVIYTTTETVITYETVTKQHKFLWWTWTTTKTVKNRTKVTKYTYKAVKTDKKPDSVTTPRAPWFKKAVATLHTHPTGSGIGITQFSNYYDFFKDEWIGDIPNAKKRGIPSYVHGPNGELRKYDPVTGEDILLFGDLPKSPYLSTFTKGAK